MGGEGEPPGQARGRIPATESFKKVALKKILVGKILDNFEILNLDKLPFEEILVRVKELARIKKLEKYVAQGRTGVATGSQRPKGPGEVPPHQYQVPSFGAQEEDHTDINAFNGKGPTEISPLVCLAPLLSSSAHLHCPSPLPFRGEAQTR